MHKNGRNLYPRHVENLIAEKSALLSKAQAFAAMGLGNTAGTLWASAAALEECLAPLLESLGHDLEAAVHRISAADCYRHAGQFTAAANLYRGALAGPLLDHTRKDVEAHLKHCLKQLSKGIRPQPRRRSAQPSA
jgi:hypothetical protein